MKNIIIDDNEISIIENTREAQNQYGHRYGSSFYIITKEQIKALLKGKQIALNDMEYSTFISMSEPVTNKTGEAE